MESLYGFPLLIVGLMLRCVTVVSQQNDLSTMLALNKELTVPGWNQNSSDYCKWVGVHCNSNGSVEKLELSHRELSGNISMVPLLKSLKFLDLSNNFFQGSIPPSIGNLAQLEFLDLSSNKFENSIPLQLGGVLNLRMLNLSNNMLAGKIPDELESLERLQELQISGNKLSGSIPHWIGNLPNLRVFTAYENYLSGRIPENLGLVSELVVLNLHSNQLEGSIPESIFASGKLEILVLTMNKLNGSLPESVGNCTALLNLRIGRNRLVGNVPVAIGNASSLKYFEADDNLLSGEIIPDFARCSSLTLLNLAFNQFTGRVPQELGGLMNLQELILSGNILFGDIPRSLLKCKNLIKLNVSGNKLNGSIPDDLCNMSKLQFLLLGQNSFMGEIPHKIGNCMRLLELQLGGNNLTGSIPPEIGKIKNLQIALNLSFNGLHGPIPYELGKLDKLVALDLSNNQFSGSIPSEIKGMMSLIDVNFSNNLLTGQVPIFGPFQKSPSSSFIGNKGLCGDPLNPCGDSYGSNGWSCRHRVSYKIVLIVVGSGLTVFVSVTIVVLLFMVRERQEMALKASFAAEDGPASPPSIVASNVFVENLRQAVDFDNAIKETLKDSNKIISGSFSTTYKVVMPSGLILSVKRLKSINRTVLHYQNKMIRELEKLGKLFHENLLRPIGFVIYEDVALLLHNYLPNGTLAQLIHNDAKTKFEPDWPRRLSIAIGSAEGLAFLHHMAIIHLDISSCNVFLDANYNPLIGEVEISKLLDPSKGTASISAVAGSIGYIPPEYAYTMQVTAPGNVYSYGVILLEIITSQFPVDEAFGEGLDLVKWVHGAPARGETPEQILDSRLSTVSFPWRQQMLAVLKVALLCTDTTPAKRPRMKKVVEMLREINVE